MSTPRGLLLPEEPIGTLDDYLNTDYGGRGIRRAVDLGPGPTIDEIAASGLRGRGGGGFPTHVKWRGLAGQKGPRYLVVNGAEGEPGTFKDRALLRANPYQLVEGAIIAAFAIDAAEVFICLKASFTREIEGVTRAVQEFQDAGICADCKVTIVAGPEEYLFGEEKAMLEVIEGNEPLPRWLPPHLHGLFSTAPQLGWQAHGAEEPDSHDGPGQSGSHPTMVNNVETLSTVTHIMAGGADWYRSMGTVESPGTVVATVVGDVARPGVGEVEMGATLAEVIDAVGGGVRPGRTIKAVFSGVANPVITAADLAAEVSYEGMSAIDSGLGSAGFIVYDDTTCMVAVAAMFSRFLSVESCGQCPPCKLGSGAITEHLERIEAGHGEPADIDAIGGWLDHVTDGNRCYLPVEERLVIASILRAFPEEFDHHIAGHACPLPRQLEMPKLVDLADGVATYDPSFWRKRPDWTYDPPTD